MSDDTQTPRRIAGLADMAAAYDGLLCDIWGVVHNGVEAHAPALDALVRFRDGGGSVVLVTNAPRPAEEVRRQLRALAVPDRAYDAVISSGDVTRRLLDERKGRSFYHLGPARDRRVFAGFEAGLAPAETAAFILCTGLFDDDAETPENYRGLLARLAGRRLEMVCANPDLVVERGGRLVYCAGALAELYARLGGRVVYAGKPHRPIYDTALSVLSRIRGAPVPLRRVLAVGDSVRTDLAGAAGAGLDALFIVGGIHAGEAGGDGAVAHLFEAAGALPRAVMEALRW